MKPFFASSKVTFVIERQCGAQALLQFSLDEAVIGEEVYAAGAYLHRPSHLGSLATEDIIRIVLILSIVAGVIMISLGHWR